MEQLVNYLFQTIHRSHVQKLCFEQRGDLTNVEFFILLAVALMLECEKDGVTLSDIVEVTNMSMSAASKKISILEKKGLLIRCISDKDKRKAMITLTENGKLLCENERKKKREWITEVISRMGVEETKQMLTLMNKMFDIMKEMEQEKDVL